MGYEFEVPVGSTCWLVYIILDGKLVIDTDSVWFGLFFFFWRDTQDISSISVEYLLSKLCTCGLVLLS